MIENLAANERPEDRYPECPFLVDYGESEYSKPSWEIYRSNSLSVEEVLRCLVEAFTTIATEDFITPEAERRARGLLSEVNKPQFRQYLAAKLGLV